MNISIANEKKKLYVANINRQYTTYCNFVSITEFRKLICINYGNYYGTMENTINSFVSIMEYRNLISSYWYRSFLTMITKMIYYFLGWKFRFHQYNRHERLYSLFLIFLKLLVVQVYDPILWNLRFSSIADWIYN